MQTFKREYQMYEIVARDFAIEDKKELAILQRCIDDYNEECETHLVRDEKTQRNYQEDYGSPLYESDDWIPIKESAFEYRQDAAARFDAWLCRSPIGFSSFNILSCIALMDLTHFCGTPTWMTPKSLAVIRVKAKNNIDAEHVAQHVYDRCIDSDREITMGSQRAMLQQKMREFTLDIPRARVKKAAQKITGITHTNVDEAARAVYQKLAIRVADKGFKLPHVLTDELAGYVGVTA